MFNYDKLASNSATNTYERAEQLYRVFLRERWSNNNPKRPDEAEEQYATRCEKCLEQPLRNFATALTHFLSLRGLDRSSVLVENTADHEPEFASWLRRLAHHLRSKLDPRTAQNNKSELQRWFRWLITPRTADELPYVFGRALRTLIDRSGLSYIEIAQRAGILTQMLYRWSAGETQPLRKAQKNVEELERILNVAPGILIHRSRRLRKTVAETRTEFGGRMASLTRLPYSLNFYAWPPRFREAFEELYALTDPRRRTGRSGIIAPGRWKRRRDGNCASRRMAIDALKRYLGYLVLPKGGNNPYLRGQGLAIEDLTLDVLADYELIEGYLEFTAVRAGYVAGRVLTEAEQADPSSIKARFSSSIETFGRAVRYFIEPTRGLLTQTATVISAEIREQAKARAIAAGMNAGQWLKLSAETAAVWAAVASEPQKQRDAAATAIAESWAAALKIPLEIWSERIRVPANRWAEMVSASIDAEAWRRTCADTCRILKRDLKESGYQRVRVRDVEENAETIINAKQPILEVIKGVEILKRELTDIPELIPPDPCRVDVHRRRREELALDFQMLTLAEMSTAVQLRTLNWQELTIADMRMPDGTIKKANLTLNDNDTYHIHVDHRDLKFDKESAAGDFNVDLPPAVTPTISTFIRVHRPYLAGPETAFLFRPNPRYIGSRGKKQKKLSRKQHMEGIRTGAVTAWFLNSIFKTFTCVYLRVEHGFGIYLMRHIAATDYVRNHPGSFLVAATMLHNTVGMIVKHYSHLCNQDTFRMWTAYYQVMAQQSKGPNPEDLVQLKDVPHKYLGAMSRAANAAGAQGLSLLDFSSLTRKAYEASLAEQFRPNHGAAA